jgi:hypothetical protein
MKRWNLRGKGADKKRLPRSRRQRSSRNPKSLAKKIRVILNLNTKKSKMRRWLLRTRNYTQRRKHQSSTQVISMLRNISWQSKLALNFRKKRELILSI